MKHLAVSRCGKILDLSIRWGRFEKEKKKILLLICLLLLFLCLFIESSGENLCTIFQCAKKKNNVAFIPYDRIFSFLSISKDSQKIDRLSYI